MDVKEKLIQMIQEASGCLRYYAELIADKLLAEGVIVPPCKVEQNTDLTNKCGSCKWSVPCKFSKKSAFGAYVECQNPNKVWRHEISKIKQRTTPKCRYYEKTLAGRSEGANG